MSVLTLSDYLAVIWFVVAWFGFNILVEFKPLRQKTLSSAMETYRHAWMATMAERPVRIMDTSVMAGLQQGTAFFASTALIAIGGAFSLLNAADRIVQIAGDLAVPLAASRTEWEIKVLGLMLILAYAFFKFSWAYRLFNYGSIVMGAVPECTPDNRDTVLAIARQAGNLNALAGKHFNRGQRAFFFAIGFLGWFAGPLALAVMTLAVLLVLIRRQFASAEKEAVLSTHQLAMLIAVGEGENTAMGSSKPLTGKAP